MVVELTLKTTDVGSENIAKAKAERRLAGIEALAGEDNHAVAFLVVCDVFAYLYDDPNCFMTHAVWDIISAKYTVVSVEICAADCTGVNVMVQKSANIRILLAAVVIRTRSWESVLTFGLGICRTTISPTFPCHCTTFIVSW